MERKKKGALILMGMCLLIGVWVSGCTDLFMYRTIGDRQYESAKAVQTSYRFDDIPIPAGMVLNRKESFVYETGATKTGLLVYEGKEDMGKATSFFKQQMPNHQWKFLSGFELHNVMLTYVKEGWCSVIFIIPQEGDAKRVEIRVGPVELKSFSSQAK
jgi:hypothetical protein